MTRRFANILIWLALTAEVEGIIFNGYWSTPLTIIGTLLFKTVPVLKVMPWDVMVVVTILLAYRGRGKNLVPAVMSSLRLAFLALLACWLWGVLRSGSAYQTIYQLRSFVMGLLVALMVAFTCKTQAHVRSLGWVIAFAALYRSAICLLFYLLVARGMPELPVYMTDHCDSVLFVSGWFVLLHLALEKRTPSALIWAVLGSALIITAIVLNNRRLAWLSVVVGFGLTYLLLPKGRVKRRINRWLLVLSPVLIAYVAAGWGSPTGIFKPVGSISTMFGSNQDASSMMRDIENYNLLVTLKSNPLLGVGWGYEYTEQVRAINISEAFSQYRYLPHNSFLGMVAFTGMLGLAGVWQLIVVTTYMHARVYRVASGYVARVASMSSIVALVSVSAQMWGDLGFNHRMVNVIMGVAVGLAARLPALTGAWPVWNPDANADTKTAADTKAAANAASQAGQNVQHG